MYICTHVDVHNNICSDKYDDMYICSCILQFLESLALTITGLRTKAVPPCASALRAFNDC